MGLQDVNGFHRVFDVAAVVDRLHCEHGIDSHWRKQIVIAERDRPQMHATSQTRAYSPADDFTRHTRLRSVYQGLPAKRIDLYAQLILHKLAGFPAREPVSSDDRGRMDFLLDELVRASKKLSGDDDNGCSTVADFSVLLLCEVDKDAASWILYGQQAKDSRAVVRDGDFLHGGSMYKYTQISRHTYSNIIYEHLVQTERAE